MGQRIAKSLKKVANGISRSGMPAKKKRSYRQNQNASPKQVIHNYGTLHYQTQGSISPTLFRLEAARHSIIFQGLTRIIWAFKKFDRVTRFKSGDIIFSQGGEE